MSTVLHIRVGVDPHLTGDDGHADFHSLRRHTPSLHTRFAIRQSSATIFFARPSTLDSLVVTPPTSISVDFFNTVTEKV
jgi:hypothetical protein